MLFSSLFMACSPSTMTTSPRVLSTSSIACIRFLLYTLLFVVFLFDTISQCVTKSEANKSHRMRSFATHCGSSSPFMFFSYRHVVLSVARCRTSDSSSRLEAVPFALRHDILRPGMRFPLAVVCEVLFEVNCVKKRRPGTLPRKWFCLAGSRRRPQRSSRRITSSALVLQTMNVISRHPESMQTFRAQHKYFHFVPGSHQVWADQVVKRPQQLALAPESRVLTADESC